MASLLPGESDTAAALIDEATIVTDLLPALHSGSIADLVFWSECELIQWIDAALKKLARTAGIFVGRSIDTNTAIGSATYALPAQHLSTIHASYNGSPLRPATTGELAARDASYASRTGTPSRWYQDTIGLARIGLALVPDAIAALWVIYHGWPREIDCAKTNTTMPLPGVLEPYVELYVLAEAYSKEGDAHAPDIASAARSLMHLYEKAALDYWGPVG